MWRLREVTLVRCTDVRSQYQLVHKHRKSWEARDSYGYNSGSERTPSWRQTAGVRGGNSECGATSWVGVVFSRSKLSSKYSTTRPLLIGGRKLGVCEFVTLECFKFNPGPAPLLHVRKRPRRDDVAGG